MAHVVMVYVVMAYVVMAYIVMAYILMNHVVIANSYGLHSYGLCLGQVLRERNWRSRKLPREVGSPWGFWVLSCRGCNMNHVAIFGSE